MLCSRSQDGETYPEAPFAIFFSRDADNCFPLLEIHVSLNDRSLLCITTPQLLSLPFSVSEAQTNYVGIMQHCYLTDLC